METPQTIPLNYRSADPNSKRVTRCFGVYFTSMVLTAIAVLLFGLLAEKIYDSLSTIPRAPSELDDSLALAAIFVWLLIVLLGSVFAAGIFRIIAGKRTHWSRRLILILGALNGLWGMGVTAACGTLEDHDYIRNVRVAWNTVIVINVALPLITGWIASQAPKSAHE